MNHNYAMFLARSDMLQDHCNCKHCQQMQNITTSHSPTMRLPARERTKAGDGYREHMKCIYARWESAISHLVAAEAAAALAMEICAKLSRTRISMTRLEGFMKDVILISLTILRLVESLCVYDSLIGEFDQNVVRSWCQIPPWLELSGIMFS